MKKINEILAYAIFVLTGAMISAFFITDSSHWKVYICMAMFVIGVKFLFNDTEEND